MPAAIAPTVSNQMTRKHFAGIASTLQLLRPDPHGSPAEYGQWVLTVAALTTTLSDTNDKFDADRFLEACG